MKSIIFFAALMLGIAHTAFGQQTTGSQAAQQSAAVRQDGAAEQEVTQLINQYEQALVRKDASALDRLWADDLTFVNPGGQLLTKAQRLENVRSGATRFDSVNTPDRKVRIYSDMAVVNTLLTFNGQYSSQERGGQYQITLVCVRRGGQWQISAIQMTSVAQQQPSSGNRQQRKSPKRN